MGITSRGDKPDGQVETPGRCGFCGNTDVVYPCHTEPMIARDGVVCETVKLCGKCICDDAEISDKLRQPKP